MLEEQNTVGEYELQSCGLTFKEVRPLGVILGNLDRLGQGCEHADVDRLNLFFSHWYVGSCLRWHDWCAALLLRCVSRVGIHIDLNG